MDRELIKKNIVKGIQESAQETIDFCDKEIDKENLPLNEVKDLHIKKLNAGKLQLTAIKLGFTLVQNGIMPNEFVQELLKPIPNRD